MICFKPFKLLLLLLGHGLMFSVFTTATLLLSTWQCQCMTQQIHYKADACPAPHP